jgi:S-adenosyl-L-methionine methyltransferase
MPAWARHKVGIEARVMSRLDSFIRRLEAQRAAIDWACEQTRALPGPALEIGLGNGRTYDHLRERLAGTRTIFAFDRALAAHPACTPDRAHLILGELGQTLAQAAARIGAPAALAHADIGSGDEAATLVTARMLGPALVGLLAPGAIVLCDQKLTDMRLVATAIPGVASERYFAYRFTP